MDNSGLSDEILMQRVFHSGSLASSERNEYGIHVFNSGSSGLIAGKMLRPKYIVSEIKKSIDTEIRELLPQEAPLLEETVLKSTFNSATQSIFELTSEVQSLRDEILALNGKVSGLEIVSESLKLELDAERLKAGINENQAYASNNQLASTIIDLQNAIQNSINESIDRVSLSARNEILENENKNLRNQLFGINTQLNTGATSGTNNKITAKFTGLGEDGDTLVAFANHKGLPNSARFKSANKLQINNVMSDANIVSIRFDVFDGERWFYVVDDIKDIPAQGQALYDIEFNIGVIRRLKPYQSLGFVFSTWVGKQTKYDTTKLSVRVTFDDNTTDSVVLNSLLQKDRN